ncbi:MAG: hypothetical protein RI897_1417 [Verrucomicrobiota bacterium]
MIDDIGDAVNEFDDEFGHGVAGGSFAAEDDGTWWCGEARVGAEPVIEGDDMEDVEVLAFVFVEAFDLDIEEGGGVDFDACALVDDLGEVLFVGEFDFAPGVAELEVFGEGFEFLELAEVFDPIFADMFGDQAGEVWVAEGDEAAWGDAIGDVMELGGFQVVEIAEDTELQEF